MISQLSVKNRWVLLLHLTLLARFVYPVIIRFSLNALQLSALIDSGFADLFLVGFVCITSVIMAKDLFIESIHRFNKNFRLNLAFALKLIPLMFASSLIFNGLAVFITQQDAASNQSMLIELYNNYPLIIAAQALIYAPLTEELLFRGLFYGSLEKRSPYLAFFVSSLLFGLAHMFASPTISLTEFAFLPGYTSLGLIIAYSYQKTRTIVTPITVHFLNNLIGIIAISFL